MSKRDLTQVPRLDEDEQSSVLVSETKGKNKKIKLAENGNTKVRYSRDWERLLGGVGGWTHLRRMRRTEVNVLEKMDYTVLFGANDFND
jgi:hypothetical protein